MHEGKNTPCKLHTLGNFAVQDTLAYLDPWITFLVNVKNVKNFDIRRKTTYTEADYDSLEIAWSIFLLGPPSHSPNA